MQNPRYNEFFTVSPEGSYHRYITQSRLHIKLGKLVDAIKIHILFEN